MKKQLLDLEGVFLLDKPVGISSNQALQKVKRLFTAKKAGHTGSLDPLASGVLPICFGKATKFSRFLLSANKTYLVTAKFGISTASGDVDGEVISTQEQAVPKLTAKIQQQLVEKFTGTIKQVPPMYSALKHQGVPLYKLARKGLSIARDAREVVIEKLKFLTAEELELLAQQTKPQLTTAARVMLSSEKEEETEILNLEETKLKGKQAEENTLTFVVSCSKGTYIRSLVIDMGEYLGCGAHVTMLRRVEAGPYSIEQTTTLAKLELVAPELSTARDKLILPLNTIIADWPEIKLTEQEALIFMHGKKELIPSVVQFGRDLAANGDITISKWARLTQAVDNANLGVAEIADTGEIKDRIFLGD